MTTRSLDREFLDVILALIDDPALPARTAMDEQKLADLAADIAAKGVIQPIILARTPEGRFEVVAGHRRTIASRMANQVTIPAIVYGSRDAALEGLKHSENKYREDLNAADEALYFTELLDRDCGGDVDRLCAQLGERRAYVEGRLVLFSGDRVVFDALREGKIQIGVAHELNKVTDEAHRRMYLDQAIRGGATIAVVRGWVQDWQRHEVHLNDPQAEASTVAAPGPVADYDFFKCVACGEKDQVHTMRAVNVHAHCELATLRPALEQFRQRGAYLRFPRTVDEANNLVVELVREFPTLGEGGL